MIIFSTENLTLQSIKSWQNKCEVHSNCTGLEGYTNLVVGCSLKPLSDAFQFDKVLSHRFEKLFKSDLR